MNSAVLEVSSASRVVRRVLVLADESANWKVAGLRQLDRIALSLHEFMRMAGEPITAEVLWDPALPVERRWLPDDSRLRGLEITDAAADSLSNSSIDLVLSTRVFLYRNNMPQVLAAFPSLTGLDSAAVAPWERCSSTVETAARAAHSSTSNTRGWRYLADESEIGACEREFLRNAGKSQDGLVSRHVNRPISRAISRLLLKLPITPSAWSIAIFALPLCASGVLLRGTSGAFLLACVIFQVYSVVDGCDGEIARAKFLQTEFGRRLDSFLDLVGNILLAVCLGIGLSRQWERAHTNGWVYISEGIAAAAFIVLSEGIVFARRNRSESVSVSSRWKGALYQRHHEFLERSGILFLGDRFAWWLVQLTKRDMAMLAFVLLAAVGAAQMILHLLIAVSVVSSALAGNAFLRQPAAALRQEAS